MYDFLLFVHVLAAFCLMVTVVMYSAFSVGAPASARALLIAEALWGIGGLGTLVFGVWLALDVDGYELWDGWIIAALILWLVASAAGGRLGAGVRESQGLQSVDGARVML
ncbi:MAG: hypothetical protein GEU88_05490, partial [Solirubrobacterales bacterium]|nr:hypothetical protein [Solirubrobacterales bacterium]